MDLYNIPGDSGGTWRLDKFVEYQHEVPPLFCYVLGEYVKKLNLDRDEIVMACWFMSCTYNEVTCAILLEIFDWKGLTPKTVKNYCENFWETYKEKLIFGSSRVYAKSMDWFPILMENFIKHTKNSPYKWIKSLCKDNSIDTYYSISKDLEKLQYVGRFARDLFMDSVMYLQKQLNIDIYKPDIIDWKNCSNLASGTLNIFYLDEEANEFDKTGKLPKEFEEYKLSELLEVIQKRISEVYPEQDNSINMFVSKVCSFRNLFKGSRYGGFHHDRELEWIQQYEKSFPELKETFNTIYLLRSEMFHKRFLGELCGWKGIRKERKKLWLTKGLTGVEMEQRLLVNIRGTNGSGKSTIPRSMIDDPEMYQVIKPYKGKPRKILTVFPTYGWIALGSYERQVGGLDQFPNKEFTEKVLEYALKRFKTYNVLLEGILASTTYSTYSDLFKRMQERYKVKPVIYYLMPPVEVCIDRIKQRNGGKEFKEDLVRSKYATMERGIAKFEQSGDFPVLVVDNSNLDISLVREQFFAEIGEIT